jgi:hypothetical protein
VLNSRGLPLAAGDILKAQIVGAIEEFQREAYTRKWEDLEETLGREEFSEFLSHVRMITAKQNQRARSSRSSTITLQKIESQKSLSTIFSFRWVRCSAN